MSTRILKSPQELMSWEMPLTRIIETNSLLDPTTGKRWVSGTTRMTPRAVSARRLIKRNPRWRPPGLRASGFVGGMM